ncbi:hypothetical protein PPGU19_088690 (plasmid) [Paraburkholderia sp. PGU19]|nr:hypothetical protein PPGU19_088690 [Paraburkholderia sp. PGU19]
MKCRVTDKAVPLGLEDRRRTAPSFGKVFNAEPCGNAFDRPIKVLKYRQADPDDLDGWLFHVRHRHDLYSRPMCGKYTVLTILKR